MEKDCHYLKKHYVQWFRGKYLTWNHLKIFFNNVENLHQQATAKDRRWTDGSRWWLNCGKGGLCQLAVFYIVTSFATTVITIISTHYGLTLPPMEDNHPLYFPLSVMGKVVSTSINYSDESNTNVILIDCYFWILDFDIFGYLFSSY